MPGRFRAVPEPTEGRRSLSPAKGAAIGRTQGAFHQGSSPEGLDLARQAETDHDHPEGEPCPQVVPILWRRSPRLFVPLEPCSDEAGRSQTRAP
jgi:hypothetical protein